MVANYSYGITSFEELEAEIERCITDGMVRDESGNTYEEFTKIIAKYVGYNFIFKGTARKKK